MRVLFLEDVMGVALGGEIKEVKNGFARNYLIPKSLATPATKDALQRISKVSKGAEERRLKTLADMKSLGEELDGSRINVEMRAGASGRLYGSVTTMVVAEELQKLTEREIDRRSINISDSIREIGIHSATVRLHPEILANISILVYPSGTDPEDTLQKIQGESEDKTGEDSPVSEFSDTDEATSTDPLPEMAQDEKVSDNS